MNFCHPHNSNRDHKSQNKKYGIKIMLPPGDCLGQLLGHDWSKQKWFETKEMRDAMYEKAVEIITDEGRVSTSLIQRKLKVGYSRAARIMDQLEDAGIIRIGPGGEKEIVED